MDESTPMTIDDAPRAFGARLDADVMSDRLLPSRGGTCGPGSLGTMRLGKDENWVPQNEYHEVLSQNVLGKESLANVKVLSYKHKPQKQEHVMNQMKVLYSSNRDGDARPKSVPDRVVPQTAMRILDAPGLLDDFYSHPVDWSAKNLVAVALSETVFLFDATSGSTDTLLTLRGNDWVTALRWTGEGAHVGVGTNTGDVQIWDSTASKQLRSLRGHDGRIGALAWSEHILATGSADKEVHLHDVRVKDHLIGRLSGCGAHADLVCGLDYSADGTLASGGNDNAVCIWDRANLQAGPLRTLREHHAAVKALRWCPWQRNVLATGGGSADRQICLWNASSGRLLQSSDAGSQVTGMVWGHQEKELLTAHGFARNQLSLWKYPSLLKATDLEGHTGRLLGLAQSPDGSFVCSASADETLRFWRVFSPSSASTGAAVHKQSSSLNPVLKTIR